MASLDAGVLLVIASNAAVASKVRQFEPSLVAGLCRSGWKVTKIKVRPQPGRYEGLSAPVAGNRAKTPIPESALDAFEQLAAGVEDGPLHDALTRMISRRREKKRS